MRNNFFILSLISIFITLGLLQPLVADKYNKKEVQTEIKKLEKVAPALKKYLKIKNAKEDIQQALKYLDTAKKLLKDGEEDKAYYRARLGLALYQKVRAQIALLKSNITLKKMKKAYAQKLKANKE